MRKHFVGSDPLAAGVRLRSEQLLTRCAGESHHGDVGSRTRFPFYLRRPVRPAGVSALRFSSHEKRKREPMHETKRRHSNERRTRNASAIAVTERALAIAARGDHREAARVALLAERLLRLGPKLRIAKASAETQRIRAEAAIAAALADVESLNPPPPRALPPVKPEHLHFFEPRPDGPVAELRRRGLIP